MKVWVQKTKEGRLPLKENWSHEGVSNIEYEKGEVIEVEGFSKP